MIGGGPAGSSAAAILAERGRDVLLLERQPFPRYSIGESLIPHCWFPLNRLGLVEKLDASDFIVHKHSVQFINTEGTRSTPFYFFEHYDHPSSRTWQVVRSEFDQLLLDNACAKGVEARLGWAARDLLREDGTVAGVVASDPDGKEHELRARVTIDASGRDAFAQTTNRWRVMDEHLKKFAIWTYYKGAKRDPGVDEGATTIAYVPEKGWFWYLPLADDVVSVGVVADKDYLFRDTRDLQEVFDREVAVQPWIESHLAPGEQIRPCQVTSEFTYRSKHCASDGLVLAGDAFSFLDPVFSSGVFLALHSGVMAGDAVEAALAEGDVSAARFADYGAKVCEAIEAMRRLVHAFYDVAFSFGDFLKVHPEMRKEVTDCLIGDLHKDFDPLFEAVGEFAAIPGPLPHGKPLERA